MQLPLPRHLLAERLFFFVHIFRQILPQSKSHFVRIDVRQRHAQARTERAVGFQKKHFYRRRFVDYIKISEFGISVKTVIQNNAQLRDLEGQNMRILMRLQKNNNREQNYYKREKKIAGKNPVAHQAYADDRHNQIPTKLTIVLFVFGHFPFMNNGAGG